MNSESSDYDGGKNIRMRHFIETLTYLFLDISGINALFRYLNRNKVIILCYHGICDDDFDLLKGYDDRHIPKSLFGKQLSYLKRKNYSFTTLSEAAEILNHRKKIRNIVVLSFDDGFRNVVENAYPLMQKYHAKGCFYLISDLIGTSKPVWTDYVETLVRNAEKGKFRFSYRGENCFYDMTAKASYEKAMKDIKARLRLLSDKEKNEVLRQFQKYQYPVPKEFQMSDWAQIQGLNKDILEVGSHTSTHPDCIRLSSDEEFDYELKYSKAKIERMVGYRTDHFNYPAGAFDERVIRQVEAAGYKTAVSLIPGFNDRKTDPFYLKRIYVNENFLFFKASVSGSYFFIKKVLGKILKPYHYQAIFKHADSPYV